MSFSFSVLASGSTGNCSVLRLNGHGAQRCMLIDAGLSPRRTRGLLESHGLDIRDVTDLLLTHLDCDHYYPGFSRLLATHPIAVHIHTRHRARALRAGIPGRNLRLFDDHFEIDDVLRLSIAMAAHDDGGTVAYVMEHDGRRLGWATDLGRMTDDLLAHFDDLHALAIESNYDPQLQRTSGRPVFLIRRITSGRGHLSNEQSLRAVRSIASRSNLSHVVALHLSRQCNEGRLVRSLYQRDMPLLAERLVISDAHQPTPMLDIPEPAPVGPVLRDQLALF